MTPRTSDPLQFHNAPEAPQNCVGGSLTDCCPDWARQKRLCGMGSPQLGKPAKWY
jgi:hypothetical protein